MRQDHRPYWMMRAGVALQRFYLNHFLRPQFDAMGEGCDFRKPWYVRVAGTGIRLGRFVHVVASWGRPVEICTFSTEAGAGELIIGDHCLLSPGVRISAATRVEIAEDCMLASGTYLTDADWHDLRDRTRAPGRSAPIVLERNVWVGDGSIVCKGVRIGENTVIGAGSVVVSDLPANSVAAGNPARVVRVLEEEERLVVTRASLFQHSAGEVEAKNAFLNFYTLCGNTFGGWLRSRFFPNPGD